jgi:beta-phosphoglucomutase family hydrolase
MQALTIRPVSTLQSVRLPIAWSSFQAVLFDLDGVVTPTAEIHERAWLELFAGWDATPADYLAYIDGRPRYDGVATFLASRNVSLPWGDASDAPGDGTVCALGNRKNETFNRVLTRDGISAYPGTIAVLDELDRAGVPAAIVSSSKNARTVLAAAGITHRFRAVVDGVTAAEVHLAGKPDPAMFLYAAAMLGAEPARTAAVEDAISGVAAASAGGFVPVIGVDRVGAADELIRAGAHIVVGDLSETLEDPA